jgi:hypothetical protein
MVKSLGLLIGSLALVSCMTIVPAGTTPALPSDSSPRWEALEPGIEYAEISSISPVIRGYALRIDLAAKGLIPIVSNIDHGKALSQRVSTFARQNDCIAAVNTTPYAPSSRVEGEPLEVVGLVVYGGAVHSPAVPPKAALVLHAESDDTMGAEVVTQIDDEGFLFSGAPVITAVGGFFVVLADGIAVSGHLYREPRTAAGVSEDGKLLYLLVVDGRQKQSVGLTNLETGLWLAWLGSYSGMTLDGGSSSAIAIRRRGGEVRLANSPSGEGIPGQERAVGCCLGFRIASLP